MEIKFKLNIKYLLLSIVTLTIAMLTVKGTLQELFYFEDALNEMVFFALCLTMCFLSFIFSFQKSK
jgi:hypothetical protein